MVEIANIKYYIEEAIAVIAEAFPMDRILLKKIDFTFLSMVGALIIIGLTMVFSATHLKIQGNPNYFLLRQSLAVLIGLGVGLIILFFDYRISSGLSRFLYGLNLLMLVLVFSPLGREVNGARSWLFFFQPAEFSKIIVIITLANYLADKESLNSYYELVGPLTFIGIPFILICLQPNLGTAMVFIFFSFIMLYFAGAPGLKLLVIVMAGILGISLLFISHYYLKTPLPFKTYQINRLTSFLHPDHDPTGTGWHIQQAVVAVGSGQFFGKGLLRGGQGRLGYLPENHTDFIFSVLCEELGFFGGFIILFLFFNLIWRGIRIAVQAKDKTDTLIAVGLIAMLLFHVLENIGMNLGIMPIAGIPLPFISFGGTAMITNLIAIGILSGIWVRRQGIMF